MCCTYAARDYSCFLCINTSNQNSAYSAIPGLSEVVGGLGLQKLQKLMPDIINTAERMDIAPHVRDGYIMMYIYLPLVFGDDFLPYVGPIIPSILQVSVGPLSVIEIDFG